MKIQIQEKNQIKWNEFVADSELGSFLQSWAWGEFQKSLGNKIWRISISDKNRVIGVALLVKQDLPTSKSYLYCPRGPVFSIRNWQIKLGQDLLTEIKKIAEKENAIFLRLEPKETAKTGLKIPSFFKRAGEIQPKNTWLLDLNQTEEEILTQMHHKTRYNIKIALKRGVKIKTSKDPKDIEIFYKILQETARRNKIKIFPKKH